MKYYWFNKICCVPGCGNTSTEGGGCSKEYFDFPAEPQARAKWLSAVCTHDREDLKVCEDHFKGEDIFKDKTNRKKLRLNSVPSAKLPSQMCVTCFSSSASLNDCSGLSSKTCDCNNASKTTQLTQPVLPLTIKKSRIRWSLEEKKILFKAVKDHGEAKFANSQVRINWASVVNHCRANRCFGNEKELRTVWQNMRVNASKVCKNQIFGSKLDRKVSRFLYGKPPTRSRNSTEDSSSTGESANNKERKHSKGDSSDDEFEESGEGVMMHYFRAEEGEEQKDDEGIIKENDLCNNNNKNDDQKTDFNETKTNEACSNNVTEIFSTDEGGEDSDEYYSITDVEEKFNIKIRPQPEEVISLLSSDDEE
ncbi:uncharacterized protein [Euwallacea fornicatus]|uniref:uncharacterized protein isoform X1 n=1 Tax=Euwallacea fornicatus TaxID=995702 RepID=UPI00338E430D